MKYNIRKKAWTSLGSLLQERERHRCFFHRGNVVVTGGYCEGYLKSTEMINISNGKSRKVGDLNVERHSHGIGIAHINGKSKLIVFGGYHGEFFLNSIEEWDDETETWSISTMKLSEAKSEFGYCQVPQI